MFEVLTQNIPARSRSKKLLGSLQPKTQRKVGHIMMDDTMTNESGVDGGTISPIAHETALCQLDNMEMAIKGLFRIAFDQPQGPMREALIDWVRSFDSIVEVMRAALTPKLRK
jgi:hypothetical protein